MEVISLGIEAVWSAQRYSRELADSVWSVRFYKHLLDVLENDTWRNYPSEAFGRPCQFDKLTDFLTHSDGLGWPTVREVLEMIEIVSKCNPPPPPRKNEPADPPITTWAHKAHLALKAAGITPLQTHGGLNQPLAHHGTNQHSQTEGGGMANGQSKPAEQLSSNSQERILRRLARDAPEILERVKAGEFKSARAAAIEAGIIRPVPTVRLVDDPERVAAAIKKHLTSDQLVQLAQALLA